MYPNSLHVAGSQLHSTVPASQLHGMAGNTTAPWWELFLLQTRRICTPSDGVNWGALYNTVAAWGQSQAYGWGHHWEVHVAPAEPLSADQILEGVKRKETKRRKWICPCCCRTEGHDCARAWGGLWGQAKETKQMRVVMTYYRVPMHGPIGHHHPQPKPQTHFVITERRKPSAGCIPMGKAKNSCWLQPTPP